MQRVLPVELRHLVPAVCYQAVIGQCDRGTPECQQYEVQRS
jgi:hypothetical protein